VEGLCRAYGRDVEKVVNYLANGLHLEGARADLVKQALAADLQGKLTHATRLGTRSKQLGGNVPGSLSLTPAQRALQPPPDPADVVTVIRGVLQAEQEAIDQYRDLARLAEESDPVTRDLALALQAEAEGHLEQFQGYFREWAPS
jgi:bacterioferritin